MPGESRCVEIPRTVEAELYRERMAGAPRRDAVQLPSGQERAREPFATRGPRQVPAAVRRQVVPGMKRRQAAVALEVIPVGAVLHVVAEVLGVDAARVVC